MPLGLLYPSRDAFHARRNHYFLSRPRQFALGALGAVAKAPLLRLSRRQRRLRWPASQESPSRFDLDCDSGSPSSYSTRLHPTLTGDSSGLRSGIPATASRQRSTNTACPSTYAVLDSMCSLPAIQGQMRQQWCRYSLPVLRGWKSGVHLPGTCYWWSQEGEQSDRTCSQD